MRAVVYHGPGHISWDTAPDPAIQEATDAIVRVDATTVCGSDLHILRGDLPEVKPGTVLGHEAVGEILDHIGRPTPSRRLRPSLLGLHLGTGAHRAGWAARRRPQHGPRRGRPARGVRPRGQGRPALRRSGRLRLHRHVRGTGPTYGAFRERSAVTRRRPRRPGVHPARPLPRVVHSGARHFEEHQRAVPALLRLRPRNPRLDFVSRSSGSPSGGGRTALLATGGAWSPELRRGRGDRGGPCRPRVVAFRGRGVGTPPSRRCVRSTRR